LLTIYIKAHVGGDRNNSTSQKESKLMGSGRLAANDSMKMQTQEKRHPLRCPPIHNKKMTTILF